MILPIGPIHPALKEPIRLKLQTEGERVVKAEIEYGYVHRVLMSILKLLPKLLKIFVEFKLLQELNF